MSYPQLTVLHSASPKSVPYNQPITWKPRLIGEYWAIGLGVAASTAVRACFQSRPSAYACRAASTAVRVALPSGT